MSGGRPTPDAAALREHLVATRIAGDVATPRARTSATPAAWSRAG
jgi:hypothetical protein